MECFLNELKVGLLTLASIILVVYMSLRVTSNQSGFGEHIQYRTIIQDAAGIFPKTPIRVAGITAGKITRLELIGTQALVTFEVLKEIKVTANSVLKIKSVGFLGDKYLDIALGEPMPNRLKENELVPSQSGGGLEDLSKDASEILADLKGVVKAIRDSVAPENQETPLKSIVANINQVVKNTKEITQTIKRLADQNESKISNALTN